MLNTLIRLDCKNILDLNVFLHSRNRKNLRRHSGMNLAAYLLVAVVFSAMLTGQVGTLVVLGAGEVVPAVLIQTGALLVLILSLFGAGQSLFSPVGLDMLRAMPVKITAIALSRLLGRYIRSLLLTLILLLPGVVCYGLASGRGVFYYLNMALGLVLLPLLPLAASVLLGTGIMALSVRTRHPVAVRTVLSVLVMAALLGAPLLSGPVPDLSQDPELLGAQLAELLPGMIHYPPAHWMTMAVEGEAFGLLLFAVVSLPVFGGVAALLCRSFDTICQKLARRSGGRAYSSGDIYGSSPLKALYHRERRRYFASSIYVSNTIIGPIMALAASAALLFVDLSPVETVLPVPVECLAPVIWSMLCVMMPPCAVAVTMEGKEIWQIKTLPVSPKLWLDSKLLWSLTLMAPSYVLSQLALTLALRPGPAELLWQIILPLFLLVFACIFALSADLRLHNFDFEKDESAVKQSLSAVVGGIGGVLAGLAAALVLVVTGGGFAARAAVLAVLALAALVLYRSSGRTDLARV